MRQTVKRYNYLVIHTKIAEHVHWEIYYTKHEILHIYIFHPLNQPCNRKKHIELMILYLYSGDLIFIIFSIFFTQ